MKNRVQLLKNYLSKKSPEIDICLYLSRRNNFVHMELDVPIFSMKNYPDLIDEINKFLSKDVGTHFELFHSQFVLTVKWKFDYIIWRNVRNEK